MSSHLFAQQSLPDVSITSSNRRVVVSWLNDYKKPIETILIQRSFDSLKNFRTIGSVLNPLNLENGFLDQQPPYDRMYYRVFIQFPNGDYVIGPSSRASNSNDSIEPIDIRTDSAMSSLTIPEVRDFVRKDRPIFSYYQPKKVIDTLKLIPESEIAINQSPLEHNIHPPQINPVPETLQTPKKVIIPDSIQITKRLSVPEIPLKKKKPTMRTAYPSSCVYVNNNQTITLDFRQIQYKETRIRFLDEQENPVLELDELPETLLYLERYNFRKSGWYHFEIYEAGILVERSKIFVTRDKGVPAEKK